MSLRCGVTGRIVFCAVLLAVAVALLVPAALAQETTPKAEIFLGYSYLAPGGNFAYNPLNVRTLSQVGKGWGTATTFNLSKHWGLTADYSGHYGNDGNFHTLMFGPKLRLPSERVTPFAEFLVGLSRFSLDAAPSSNAFGLLAGGGMDININRKLAWRLFQVDYLHGNNGNGNVTLPHISDLDGARVQTGLVFLLGGAPPLPPPTAACTASPTEVMAGEPVTVNANVSNWPPKHAEAFTWTATGGKVQGKDASATVDTTGLAPGSYNVTTNVTDNKKLSTSCQASFTVKEPPKHPPTMTCSANPTTVRAGTPSTVTCECTSPDQGVQVTIADWKASSGTISGTGNTATLDTAGAQPGPITVSATCNDNRGLNASSEPVTVTVEQPPAAPQARDLGDVNFKKNSARVDNEAKGKLDQMADEIKADPNNKAVVIGYYDPAEKAGKKLAAERAVNTKAYLTQEKGIDPNILDVYTSDEGGMRAKVVLVPAGATYSGGGEKVDESKVKATKAPAHRAVHKKKAAPAAKP